MAKRDSELPDKWDVPPEGKIPPDMQRAEGPTIVHYKCLIDYVDATLDDPDALIPSVQAALIKRLKNQLGGIDVPPSSSNAPIPPPASCRPSYKK